MKRTLRLSIVLITAFYFLSPCLVRAQLSQGGLPRSFSLAMASDTTGMVNITPPATDMLQREDEQTPVPYRFALNIPVDISTGTSGKWMKAPDGTNVWRLSLKSTGALAITLYFDRFRLAEGGKLFVYNPRRTQLIGAFTSLNNNSLSTFATALIYGDQLTIEYNAADGVASPVMHISEVSYAYRGISDFSGLKTGFGGSGKCEVNVNCDEGSNWQKEKRGVARVQVKRGATNVWCTGSMVNNTMNDGKPYFLTADHCGNQSTATDLSQWIFYFNYEGTACPNPGTEPALHSLTGASMKAHGGNSGTTGSDFYLVLLQSTVPTSYNVYYNGWSRETTEPSMSGVGIHHPAGDIKKVSTYTVPLQQSNWNGGIHVSHWLVTWSGTPNGHGTTEGGSSGSPLFDSQGRLVGTLTGGQSSCDSANLNSPDYYGQFAYHWDKNGTDSSSVLKYWLDPGNTGAMTLNGWALSVDEAKLADWLTLYPNPVTDKLYLKINESPGKDLQVTILDLWGKVVRQGGAENVAGPVYQLDMSAVPCGMYMVKVSDGNREVIRKTIKQ